jgi:diacylglycerol kinase
MSFFSPKHRALSFKYAFQGVLSAFLTEPHLKLHFLAGFITIIAGVFFQLSQLEWIAIITMIGFVLSLELTNTAIEAVVNGFTSEIHPAAKMAKDISAGAVLIAAMTAATVGITVFLPHLLVFLKIS